MNQQLQATITSSTELPQLPSGSAIQILGDEVYIVSDDAPYFYRCGITGMPVDSLRILHLPKGERRIPKPVKPDYEAAVIADVDGRECLVAFGSGSLRPQRDSVFIVALKDTGWQRVAALDALYTHLRQQAGIAEKDFNIEAAALHDRRLLLFNRGSNHIFFLDWPTVSKHLLDGGPLPSVTSAVVTLPRVGGYPAGISGACFLDKGQVLFSASVEATTNWVSDGAVLGSYVGIITLNKNDEPTLRDIAPILSDTRDTIKYKVEGIVLYGPKRASGLNALGIVDNDDGSSRLLQISLSYRPQADQGAP